MTRKKLTSEELRGDDDGDKTQSLRDQRHWLSSRTLLQISGAGQRISGIGIASFAMLHLASPILGSLAPSGKAEDVASSIMLAGREVYQGSLSEPILVVGSFVTHVIFGALKRSIMTYRSSRFKKNQEQIKTILELPNDEDLPSVMPSFTDEGFSDDSISSDEDNDTFNDIASANGESLSRSSSKVKPITRFVQSEKNVSAPKTLTEFFGLPINAMQVAGWLIVPLASYHAIQHRFQPKKLGISPSFISYSFPGYLLSRDIQGLLRSIVSGAIYGGLSVAFLYHALIGIRRMIHPTAPATLRRRRRGNQPIRPWYYPSWMSAFIGSTALISIALIRFSVEGAPVWMISEYKQIINI